MPSFHAGFPFLSPVNAGVLRDAALQPQSTQAGLRTAAFRLSMIPTSRTVKNIKPSFPK